MYSAIDNTGDSKVCLTSIFKVNYGGSMSVGMHLFELRDHENVISDTKIIILAYILPDILKHVLG